MTSGSPSTTGTASIDGTVSMTAGNDIVVATNGPFDQTGNLTITGPDFIVGTTGKWDAPTLAGFFPQAPKAGDINNDVFKPEGKGANINFDGKLSAPNSTLFLLADKGTISGGSNGNPQIFVKQLGVSGQGDLAALFGEIDGNGQSTAALQGRINPFTQNEYKFNDCAIGSPTCIVLPTFTPIQPQAISEVDILFARPAEEDVDAPLINIFDEERLCEQLLRRDPERAREVCR
jgi:hypothetical protein